MWTEQQYELAARLAEEERAASLEALRTRMRQDAPGSVDGNCLDCGDVIEPARLAVLPGAVRCVGCQVAHEKRQAQHARY
ncbi:molecular chaperone DnaK [Achromobacter pulmonis]|uniref:Molecular chaperone DnaK n=2 Tax=Burkholderiales TaxID=80840 RepID=A0A2N8K869_9BURK|nr:TraR/DksA C4-type zinc finger protein [Achromobacter pulmonis]PND29642.1 molecular chaperone DnaK [Achromobacter pulmonis]TFL14896.1 TraR/DksA family transcriptional regulator [Pusillimonas caeni]